jgi:hypothetical protein
MQSIDRRPSLERSTEALDLVRRQWLDGLRHRHAQESTAASAFELARGLYRCGEYDEALDAFTVARNLAPHEPSAHLALVRMGSTLDRPDVEDVALSAGLSRFPDFAPLVLHDALRRVPGDLDAARSRLQRCAHDGTCREFLLALDAICGIRPIDFCDRSDPRAVARHEGLAWLLERTRDPKVFSGLPVDVLRRALMLAPHEGLTLECGVYFGRSLRQIAAATRGDVHGFDSFQGLPEAWSEREGAGAYSTGRRRPTAPVNAVLHEGWFEDTLPSFFASHQGPVRLLHIDCDLYSSTRTVLEAAAPRLVVGSVVVFDDLLGYPGYREHELRALEEFTHETGMKWEVIVAALLGREVAVRITGRTGVS